MNAAARLGVFVGALSAVFAAAAGIGAAVGPIDVGGSGDHQSMGGESSTPAVDTDMPRGLSVEADGVRLELGRSRIDAGTGQEFTFRLLDSEGSALTRFDTLHERPLHLIVLNRDLVGYHHLHPSVDADGTWTVDLPELSAGSYRLFADVQPVGSDNLTLAADLLVDGDVALAALPRPSAVFEIDGLTVALDGRAQVGDSELAFTVTRDGRPVSTEPYLGALGHLVAIRADDLAFLHVHPHDADTGPITFTGQFPTAGMYRLFFDFSVDGVVRTAAFTVDVGTRSGAIGTEEGDDHGH